MKRDLECEDKLDLEIHNPSICFCVCWEDWLNHIHFRQIKCYKITTLITVLKFICSNKQQYINCAEISTFALQNQLQIQFGQSSCYYETGKASKNREHAKLLCSHQCYSRCRRFFPKPRSFFIKPERNECCSAVSGSKQTSSLLSAWRDYSGQHPERAAATPQGKATREMACFCKFMGIWVLKPNLP